MRKLFLFGLLVAAAPAASQVPQVNLQSQGPVVGISVSETVESAPDLAIFDVGVSTIATTATAALTENARKMENVIARVRAAGVPARDIQTTGINLHPQHNEPVRGMGGNYAPRIVGYNASNNVRIRYRKLSEVGRLIDALVAAGATNINGPMFSIEDPEARVREARDKALASAEQRANEYARKTGARSVRLLSITEGAQGRYGGGNEIIVTGSRIGGAGMAAAPSPIEPGQIATVSTIFVQYALER